MPKEQERKFEKILKKSGMENLLGNKPAGFEGLMKREGLGELTKEKFYFVICHDPSSLESGKAYVYDKFRTKAERDKWYEESGREVENLYGVTMEMPDVPMTEKDAEKKSG